MYLSRQLSNIIRTSTKNHLIPIVLHVHVQFFHEERRSLCSDHTNNGSPNTGGSIVVICTAISHTALFPPWNVRAVRVLASDIIVLMISSFLHLNVVFCVCHILKLSNWSKKWPTYEAQIPLWMHYTFPLAAGIQDNSKPGPWNCMEPYFGTDEFLWRKRFTSISIHQRWNVCARKLCWYLHFLFQN